MLGQIIVAEVCGEPRNAGDTRSYEFGVGNDAKKLEAEDVAAT